MKHGETYVEWQISIQGKHVNAFGIIYRKEKEALNIYINVFVYTGMYDII